MTASSFPWRRLHTLALIVTLCASPVPARSELAGWVWAKPHTGYGYSVSESGWVYFCTLDETLWFYDFSAGLWTSAPAGGWLHFQWPYLYSIEAGTWLYAQSPPSGLWIFHVNLQSWTRMP